jgi:hypothetical protein
MKNRIVELRPGLFNCEFYPQLGPHGWSCVVNVVNHFRELKHFVVSAGDLCDLAESLESVGCSSHDVDWLLLMRHEQITWL